MFVLFVRKESTRPSDVPGMDDTARHEKRGARRPMGVNEKRRRWRGWVALLCIAALLLPLALAYMRWEYRHIRVTRVALSGSSRALEGLRIVYAADFQYDMKPEGSGSIEAATFQRAMDLIEAQGADIVLLGGDYATYASNSRSVSALLAQLDAPYGVYGVFGNHDAPAREALKALLPNIRFLENEAALTDCRGARVAIYGVEDLWTGQPSIALEAMDGADLRLLLTHNPDYCEALSEAERAAFDLALAGHTHAGQVTWFGLAGVAPVLQAVTAYGERYRYGETMAGGLRVFVTSGLGGAVRGLPLRFGAPPEIVLLECRPAEG